MQSKYDILQEKRQEGEHVSQELAQLLEGFLSPLLLVLDRFLDKRLIRTLVQVCVAIIRFRNTKQGLLLSELGSYLDGYAGLSTTAPAGTKRISNLLRSIKWSVLHIDRYLLEEADKEVKKLKEQGKRILCIWDGSVIEKPESSKIEGLCPVISSKAKRLQRSRKGLVFNFPPKSDYCDRNAVDRSIGHRNGRDGKSCVDELVDNERRLCKATERTRRNAPEKMYQAMGRYSPSHL